MVSVKQLFFPIVIFVAILVTVQGELNFKLMITSCMVYRIGHVTSGQTDAVPRRGTVRLVRNGTNSPSYSSGRVQIYLTSWGHMCDDVDFAITEANVICHQQGYTGASSYSRASSDLYVLAVYIHCSSIILLTSFLCYKILYSWSISLH